MKKKQWKARAKKAERGLRDQKAVSAALEESVKRVRERNGFLTSKYKTLLDDYAELRDRHEQLQREYEKLVGE